MNTPLLRLTWPGAKRAHLAEHGYTLCSYVARDAIPAPAHLPLCKTCERAAQARGVDAPDA